MVIHYYNQQIPKDYETVAHKFYGSLFLAPLGPVINGRIRSWWNTEKEGKKDAQDGTAWRNISKVSNPHTNRTGQEKNNFESIGLLSSCNHSKNTFFKKTLF